MFSTFKTKLAAYIEKLLELATPVGTCIFVMGTEIPEGFLAVNGQKVYQNVHPRLYAVLSPLTQLSKGTDSTGAYVTLPNADGRVLQGTNSATSVGQLLNASLPNIVGSWSAFKLTGGEGQSGAVLRSGNTTDKYGTVRSGTSEYQSDLIFSAVSFSSIFNGATVQPSAALCLVAIRF